MRVGVLFSGGKDSTLALHLAKEQGLKIECLLSIIPKTPESYMFHYPNMHLVDVQAKAMGIPIINRITKGNKEEELKDLKYLLSKAISRYNIEGIVTGVIRSSYQATRIKRIAKELSLKVFNPLWLKDDEEVYSMLSERNFRVIIVGVYAYPLSEKYLGEELSKEVYEELLRYKKEYGISLVGEGGELETFVVDAPLFNFMIEIIECSKEYKRYEGTLKIKKVRLVKKDKK